MCLSVCVCVCVRSVGGSAHHGHHHRDGARGACELCVFKCVCISDGGHHRGASLIVAHTYTHTHTHTQRRPAGRAPFYVGRIPQQYQEPPVGHSRHLRGHRGVLPGAFTCVSQCVRCNTHTYIYTYTHKHTLTLAGPARLPVHPAEAGGGDGRGEGPYLQGGLVCNGLGT